MAKSTLTRGKAAFLDYYSHLFPNLDLASYLSKKNPPVLLVSPLHESEIKKEFSKSRLSWQPLDWFPHAISWPKETAFNTSLPGFAQGWLYSLNPASLLPVLALRPHPGDTILDACAAPGGKTLATLILGSPTIIANDVSLPRFKRLKTVLTHFGYPEVPATCHPVQALRYHLTGQFDKILLDAPCSSEKHVYNSKAHLKIWSEKRIGTLAHLQELLITSLIPLLKPGGSLVYSTCALSPQENEEVIDHTLEKHPELKLKMPVQRLNDPRSSLDPMFIAHLSRQH